MISSVRASFSEGPDVGVFAADGWRIYSYLTRAENAFRCMKSPLSERPIFHYVEHRVESHIFLCVLAYHLLVAIETTLLRQEIHTSWASVRENSSLRSAIDAEIRRNTRCRSKAGNRRVVANALTAAAMAASACSRRPCTTRAIRLPSYGA